MPFLKYLASLFHSSEAEQPQLEKLFGRGRPSIGVPPASPGIYRWVQKSTKIRSYIGKTANLLQRRQQHLREGTYNLEMYDFAWKEAKGDISDYLRLINNAEKAQIAKHNPPGNRNKGGGGRLPRH